MSIIGKLNRSGMEACRNGFFKEAERHLLAALDHARLTGSQCTEAKIENNLGIFYELQGAGDKAHHHYCKALHLMKSKLSLKHPLYVRLTESLARVEETGPMGSVSAAR